MGRNATLITDTKNQQTNGLQTCDEHKKDGAETYKSKQSGRSKLNLNPSFVKKVAEIRESIDYGSEKLHFVLKKSGFGVSQHIIQRILNEQGLTNPCPKLR